MFLNTLRKKHRKLHVGFGEVTRAGRRQGRHATITFGYQPKASGKDMGRVAGARMPMPPTPAIGLQEVKESVIGMSQYKDSNCEQKGCVCRSRTNLGCVWSCGHA